MGKSERLEPLSQTPRSPQRQVLAAAIARVARLRNDLDTARDAAGRAKRRKWAAEAALEAPPEREGDLAETFIAAISAGEPGDIALAPPRHRNDVALEHRRAVEHWGKVESACAEVAADAESALSYAVREVATRADDILRAESAAFVGDLVAAAEKAQAELIEMRVALRFMVSNRLCGDEELHRRARALLLAELPVPTDVGSHSHKIFDAHPRHQQWSAAREALKADPDAILPGDAA
jgi:hypothetical protein